MSHFPLSTAIIKSLKNYNFATFKSDLVAAFVVSLMALPLSMALSIAIGLPPQHGIYTAIVAGAVVPLFGGSVSQVSGPTAAFVVILAPIVSEFGLRGIIWCSILAGVILLVFGFARLGKLINYVPYPVTTGFTSGIAVVIAVLSLNDLFGLGIAELSGSFIEKTSVLIGRIGNFNPVEFTVGAVTLFLLFYGGRIIKFIPSAILAIAIGTILAMVFSHGGHDVVTIGTRFSYIVDGVTMPGIPPYPPMLHMPEFASGDLFSVPDSAEWRKLLFPSFAIAILAALESLLSATVADSMAGTKHDPNAELNAMGIGNILSALAAGIPATGAIARTAASINNGAKTPLAASMHAIFIMLYVILLAPYIAYIPMAALAALLIHTAYRMSHLKQFIRTIQIAPRSDVVVLLTCFTLTVFVDMVAGVGVGMVCAAFLLIKRITDLTSVETEVSGAENGVSKRKLPKGMLLYRIRGPLFFGTIEKAFDRYNFTHDLIDKFVVDISDVPLIDMTGLVAMKSMFASIANEKRSVIVICNVPDVTDKLKKKISGHRVDKYVKFYSSLDEVLG